MTPYLMAPYLMTLYWMTLPNYSVLDDPKT